MAKAVLLLCLLCDLPAGCLSASTNLNVTEEAEKTFTKQERICGVAKLWAAVEYKYAEQAEKDEEYFRLLEKMLALLKDNHTHLANIPRRESLHKPNIYLEVVEDEYVVTGFYGERPHPNVKLGDVICAVDGRDAEQAVEEVKPYICASSRTERVNSALGRMLWREEATDVALTIRRLQHTFQFTLPADIPYRRRRWVGGFDFSHRLIDNKYGYMRISNFWNRRVVEEFTKAIEDLRECEGLILDLRDNPGGNENYSSEIAARLLNKRIYWYRPLGESASIRLVHKKLMEADVRDVDQLKLEMGMSTTPSGLWKYDERVVILVNWRTGSAAEGFVGALQDSGRAVIIGQPTSGGTGMPYYLDLPGGAKGRICRNGHVRLDGSRFHGVGAF
ncbi:MAG: S41 family peptidase [Planctomycetota bacterium]|jgi:C-terminal processing protease CtpA/Prc